MKRIYIQDNHIVFQDGAQYISVLPTATAYYSETDSGFRVDGSGKDYGISKASISTYFQADGVTPFTEDSLRKFLSTSLGSSLAAPPAGFDAFGRLRVSNTSQRLDVEFIYSKQEEYFDEVATGAGSVVHNADSRDLTLATNGTGANSAEMASYYVPYTAGNSQLIDMTGVLNSANIDGGTAEVFLRSKVTGTVTEEVIPQSEWSGLQSGIDWSKSQIFVMDFQSLKVGRIRFGLSQEGAYVPVAQIVNDNKRETGYWQLPNLPVYYKIYNAGGFTYSELGYGDEDNGIGFRFKIAENANATMRAICCTVKSEGGLNLRDLSGLPRVADTGTTRKSTVAGVFTPILSIRPKETFYGFKNQVLSIPRGFAVKPTESINYVVIHDGTLVGASWQDVDVNESCMEKDVAATAISGGHVIYSDYVYADATNGNNPSVSPTAKDVLGKTPLWNRQGSETGIITIAAVKLETDEALCSATINWEEIV